MKKSISHTTKKQAIIAKRPAIGIPIKVENLSKELKDFLFKIPRNLDKIKKMQQYGYMNKRIRIRKKPEHYVDNKLFLKKMIEYKKVCNKAKREGKGNPPVTK